MPNQMKVVGGIISGRNQDSKDRLSKLYVDRDEVNRVLTLWKRSSHPEAAERIREFEQLLDSIDAEILEIKTGEEQH